MSTANEKERYGGGEEAAVTIKHQQMAAFLLQTGGELQLKKKYTHNNKTFIYFYLFLNKDNKKSNRVKIAFYFYSVFIIIFFELWTTFAVKNKI